MSYREKKKEEEGRYIIMNKEIVLNEYSEKHRQAIENIIRKTWNYDLFCSPKVAKIMSKVYLNSCLTNQTFTRVAEIDGEAIGIIMGKNIKTHKAPFKYKINYLASIVRLMLSKEGRATSKIFESVQDVDKEMLDDCLKDYKGELAFFAVNEDYRGMGLGRMLFDEVKNYMKAQKIRDFYLFTDTSCNYKFYEHLGLVKRNEKPLTIDAKGKIGEMSFFIYDYTV